jgi:hypothetical protein
MSRTAKHRASSQSVSYVDHFMITAASLIALTFASSFVIETFDVQQDHECVIMNTITVSDTSLLCAITR